MFRRMAWISRSPLSGRPGQLAAGGIRGSGASSSGMARSYARRAARPKFALGVLAAGQSEKNNHRPIQPDQVFIVETPDLGADLGFGHSRDLVDHQPG